MNPLVLSGSSLNIFLECPKEWEFAYLWAKAEPPSYKMALGTAAHAAVEYGLGEKLNQGALPPLVGWLSEFDKVWFEETRFSRPKNSTIYEAAETYRASGHRCVKFYYDTIAPTVTPVLVEQPFVYTINDHVWTGTADLVDRAPDGRLRLRDHKFTGKRPDNAARYIRPMIGYYLGIKRLYGDELSNEVVLDYIIRNKTPIHHQIVLTVGEHEILTFATDIEAAVASIEAGRFPPLGRLSGACRWCPYQRTCPDAKI